METSTSLHPSSSYAQGMSASQTSDTLAPATEEGSPTREETSRLFAEAPATSYRELPPLSENLEVASAWVHQKQAPTYNPLIVQPNGSQRLKRIFRIAVVTGFGGLVFLLAFLITFKLFGTTLQHWFAGIQGSTLAPVQAGLMPTLQQDMTLLVMGVDVNHSNPNAPFDGTRTDTMLLMRLKAKTQSFSLISLPRDSKVYLAGGRGIDKLNAAHAIGGPELALQTVQETLGIPVDHYMVVNLGAVRQAVDAVGGIDMTIPKALHYTDHTAKLRIDFEPGKYHLDGKQAEAYLRFRHDALGDIGRIKRQQEFVWAVMQKLKHDPFILTKLPGIFNVVQQEVKTDLPANQLVAVANLMKQANTQTLQVTTLPGTPSQHSAASYWIINPSDTEAVLKEFLAPEVAPVNQSDSTLAANTLKVGLYYVADQSSQVTTWQKALEAQGVQVVCKHKVRQLNSQLWQRVPVASLPPQWMETLTKVSPEFSEMASFATYHHVMGYESPACNPQEQLGIVLGTTASTPKVVAPTPNELSYRIHSFF
ncbi:MAG: LCP family protein [Vampirovibrionales bacterium]